MRLFVTHYVVHIATRKITANALPFPPDESSRKDPIPVS